MYRLLLWTILVVVEIEYRFKLTLGREESALLPLAVNLEHVD
jgi:hypothetical protein